MAEFFANGHIVVGILLLMCVEAFVLIIIRKKTSSGIRLPELLITLSSGAALLLALHASLVGKTWEKIALWLTVALLLHVLDLWFRWTTK